MMGKVDIAGPPDSRQASTWQVVATLTQNAFFQLILPGFKCEVGRA